jgi:hypothetical protein
MKSDAYLSPDRKYRYWLIRVWDDRLPLACWIGVNPSTADERENDQTITKEIGFSSRLGYGGFLKLNVGAYRETNPRKWRKVFDPIGPENSAKHLVEYAERFNTQITVAAWGKNGSYFIGRCEAIIREFQSLQRLGRNPDGTPRHPLMLPYSTPLERYELAHV